MADTKQWNLTSPWSRTENWVFAKKKLVPGNTGWQNLCCRLRYLQMNGRRISACRQKDQQWHHQQQNAQVPRFFLSSYSSMMQTPPKCDILPCSFFSIKWKFFSIKWKYQYKWLWVKDRVKVTSQHWATETVLVSNFASNTLQPQFKRLKDKRCFHLL